MCRVVVFGLGCWLVVAAQPRVIADDDVPATLMQRKLQHAQGVLKGVVLEDYAMLSQNAAALSTLARQQWSKSPSDAYRAQLKIFQFASEELERLANEKNMDGAAVAYVQLSLSCVNCHRQLRKE